MYSTAYNLWTFTWFVHFELPFRLKGTDKIHTEGLSKFHSNMYSILFGAAPLMIEQFKNYLSIRGIHEGFQQRLEILPNPWSKIWFNSIKYIFSFVTGEREPLDAMSLRHADTSLPYLLGRLSLHQAVDKRASNIQQSFLIIPGYNM